MQSALVRPFLCVLMSSWFLAVPGIAQNFDNVQIKNGNAPVPNSNSVMPRQSPIYGSEEAKR